MVTKSIKLNYIYNLAYQLLTMITPLITAPYLSRVLQPDGIGTISFAESVVSYFTLFAALGINTYGQREISYVRDDRKKRSIVFWNIKILSFFTAVMAGIFYFLFVLIYESASPLFLVLSLNIIAVAFDVTWLFQGLEEFQKIVLKNTVIRILNILFIFLLVKSKDDVLIYVLESSSFLVLGHLSMWTYLPNYIDPIRFKELSPFKNIGIVLALFLPTIAVQIYTVLDKTMIGFITGNSFENGYYEQASKCSKMLLSIVTSLGTVVTPRIGYLYQRKQYKEICRIMYRGYHFVWFLGMPLCIGTMMASNNMVPWFYGAGYDKVATLLKILALLILVIGINNVLSVQYFIPTKQQKLLTETLMLGACTNFILNLFLIPRYKSIGAAVASVVAETVIAITQLWLVRDQISMLQVLKEGKNYYISAAVMTVVLFPLVCTLPASIINTCIIVIVGMAAYFVALVVLRDTFFLTNVQFIFHKLTRKKDDTIR